nr:hypothetical protein Q903MT_gene2708 [Picea sitchensis]
MPPITINVHRSIRATNSQQSLFEVIRLNALLYEFMLAYQSCFALINYFYKDMSISSYIK